VITFGQGPARESRSLEGEEKASFAAREWRMYPFCATNPIRVNADGL